MIIKPCNGEINTDLRNLYLQSLAGGVGGGATKEIRKPIRNLKGWEDIPPCNSIDITKEKIWVWSDLHFLHKNIIEYSSRPYPDIDTMTEHLIANFNEYVQPNDVSIWVGDVSFCNSATTNRILYRCNGYKILIVGNHDFDRKVLKPMAFDEVHIVYNLTVDDVVLAFTHYPFYECPKPWINIHGHMHIASTPIDNDQLINVNCEFHEYKPISLDKIAEWAKFRVNFL